MNVLQEGPFRELVAERPIIALTPQIVTYRGNRPLNINELVL